MENLQERSYSQYDVGSWDITGDILNTRGYQIDTIYDLGSAAADIEARTNWRVIRSWETLANRSIFYHGCGSKRNAFRSTLTANKLPVPSEDNLQHLNADSSVENPERNSPAVQWKSISDACLHRRLFLTSRGNIGLAPVAAEVGDLVCVLVGALLPYILRRDGDYYRLIGRVYLHDVPIPPIKQMKQDIRSRIIELQGFSIK
jgi:hypothetical protein